MHLKSNLAIKRTRIHIRSIWGSSFSDFTYKLHYQQSRRQHIWHICIHYMFFTGGYRCMTCCMLSLVWCDVTYFGICVPMLQRNLLVPILEWEIGAVGLKLWYPFTKLHGVMFPNTVTLILTIVKTSFRFSVQIDHHYLEDIIQVLVHDCDYP